MMNLITSGYAAAPDQEFVKKMMEKLDRIVYQRDEERGLEQVMLFAEQVWNDRTKRELWCKNDNTPQILAMKSEIKTLKDTVDQQAATIKSFAPPKSSPPAHDSRQNDSNKRKKYDPYAPANAWKWVPPKTGEPRTKTVRNREFHWCTHHTNKETNKNGMWVTHNPADCKLKTPSTPPSAKKGPRSDFHAMHSIIEAYDNDEE
jgi:hypothetical protein